MDLFVAGAESVTLRWNTVASVEELREAASLCDPAGLFVGLEFPGGRFLRHRKDARDARGVVSLAEELGLGVVFMVEDVSPVVLRGLPLSSQVANFVQGPVWGRGEELEALGFAGALGPAVSVPAEEASS